MTPAKKTVTNTAPAKQVIPKTTSVPVAVTNIFSIEQINAIVQNRIDQSIAELRKSPSLNISDITALIDSKYQANFNAIALSQKINSIYGVTLTSPTFVGGTVVGLTDGDIPNGITVSNYLPLTGGTLTGALAISSGGAQIT